MIYLAQNGVKHPTFKNTNDMTPYLINNDLIIDDVKKICNIWKITLKK